MKIDNVFTGWYATNKILVNNQEVSNQLANSTENLQVLKQKTSYLISNKR